jgi:hypothetical protein
METKWIHDSQQLLEFMCRTSLEAPGVVEDKFVIAPENQLILDVVFPALTSIGKDAVPSSPVCDTQY